MGPSTDPIRNRQWLHEPEVKARRRVAIRAFWADRAKRARRSARIALGLSREEFEASTGERAKAAQEAVKALLVAERALDDLVRGGGDARAQE